VVVVEQGRVTRSVAGRSHAVAPPYDVTIEGPLGDYFDRYHLVRMENFALLPEQMAETLGTELVMH